MTARPKCLKMGLKKLICLYFLCLHHFAQARESNSLKRHRIRHSRKRPIWPQMLEKDGETGNIAQEQLPVTPIVHPCQLPWLDNVIQFSRVCQQYYGVDHLCIPPSSGDHISNADVRRMESLIAGQAVVCSVDADSGWSQLRTIGRLSQRQQREQRRRRIIAHGITSAKERPALMVRPRFSLTVLETFQATSRPMDCLPFNTTTKFEMENDSKKRQTIAAVLKRLPHLAEETRQRWSLIGCETDVAVLVIGVDDEKNKAEKCALVAVGLSEQYQELMGDYVSNLTDSFHGCSVHFHDRLYEDHLEPFLARLFQIILLTNDRQQRGGYIVHKVPTWAAIILVSNLTIGLIAAYLGHWINTTRMSKSTEEDGKKPGNRKWKAGFSGGMWGNKSK